MKFTKNTKKYDYFETYENCCKNNKYGKRDNLKKRLIE